MTPGPWLGGGLNGSPGRGGSPARREWLDEDGIPVPTGAAGLPAIAASVRPLGKDGLWTIHVQTPDGKRGEVYAGAFVGTKEATARTRAMWRADEMLRVFMAREGL